MNKDQKSMNSLQIQTFGYLKVFGSEGTLDEKEIRSVMVSKLLVYIIFHRKKALTVQELCEVLWQEGGSDNPAGALKNLVYRLRMCLKKIWGDYEFIITGRGTYQWNPEINLEVDAEAFEYWKKKGNAAKDDNEKIYCFQKASDLFKGEFVPVLSEEYWITSQAAYYHSLYLAMVKELAGLLEKEQRYQEMSELCNKAVTADELDEELHIYYIRALLGEQKQNLALEHYHMAVRVLYEKLGTSPSKELREAYDELLKQTNEKELDILVIQEKLREEESEQGAFYCEFGVFKKVYGLEIRRSRRMGISMYLLLISLHNREKTDQESAEYLRSMNKAMDRMQDVLIHSLRSGDVVSKYSSSQFIVMLETCAYEVAQLVAGRIEKNFYADRRGKRRKVKIQYSLNEVF